MKLLGFAMVGASFLMSGCATCKRAFDLDTPIAPFKRVARSSMSQPFEVWRNDEAKITCYRIWNESVTCIKD